MRMLLRDEKCSLDVRPTRRADKSLHPNKKGKAEDLTRPSTTKCPRRLPNEKSGRQFDLDTMNRPPTRRRSRRLPNQKGRFGLANLRHTAHNESEAISKTICEPLNRSQAPTLTTIDAGDVVMKNSPIVANISRHEIINKPSDRDPFDDVCWEPRDVTNDTPCHQEEERKKDQCQRHVRDMKRYATVLSLNASPACLSTNVNGLPSAQAITHVTNIMFSCTH